MRDAFQGDNYIVRCAADDVTGMAEFLARPPHLVVTNITSDQQSIGNLLAMKRAAPGVKIVAMSGGDPSGATRRLNMATHLGADHVLAKPVDLSGLLRWAAALGL